MSTINESGFCSEDIKEWIEKHRNDNKVWFSFCEKINRFAQNIMLSLEIHENDLTELICATLLTRALSNFQGVIILAERGMLNESRAVLRSLLERTFSLVAIDKNKQICTILVFNDYFQKLNYLKAVKRRINEQDFEGDLQTINTEIKKIKAEISERIIEQFNIRDFACEAELTSLYDTEYKLLCGSLHVNVSDSEQYLEYDETEK